MDKINQNIILCSCENTLNFIYVPMSPLLKIKQTTSLLVIFKKKKKVDEFL